MKSKSSRLRKIRLIRIPARWCCLTAAFLVAVLLASPWCAWAENMALSAKVEASSFYQAFRPEFAVDGVYQSTASRWLNDPKDDQPWIVIDFGKPQAVTAVALVFDGLETARGLNCSWQVELAGDDAGDPVLAEVKDNQEVRSLAIFSPVTTDKLRVRFTRNSLRGNINRIHQIEVWPEGHDLASLPDVRPGLESFPVPLYPENAGWNVPAAYQGPGGPAEAVVEVGAQSQLFVDNHLFQEAHNLIRRLNRPVKYENNPVLVADQPWEYKGNPEAAPSVLKIDGEFKMWYIAGNVIAFRQAGLAPISDSRLICYATSQDGIHWIKPNLGIVEFQGSKENNIVLRPRGSHIGEGSVHYQPGDEYPYKLLTYEGTWPYDKDLIKARGFNFSVDQHGHYAYQSKDGIRWELLSKDPAPSTADRGNMSYDSKRNLYMQMGKGSYKGVRSREYAESPDLIQWGPKRYLLIPQWLANPDNPDSRVDPPGTHFYGHLIWNHGSLYLGYLEILNANTMRMHIQLMSSRDLVHWNRMSAPEPFLDQSGGNSDWETGGLFHMPGTAPVEVGEDLYIYYDASTFDHRYARDPQFPGTGGIGLARLPIDRFVAILPDDHHVPATWTTVPLRLRGEAIYVNANAKEGLLRLELLDLDGNVLPGFSVDDCEGLVMADQVKHPIVWQSGKPLPEEVVRIRFILREAELYSFHCR
ncbi:MAG: discoidin domain-containing protein [Kiritimatiellales bacterium]|nr:discoidin domain-containing protein [Kiritimatiellales bacterium]